MLLELIQMMEDEASASGVVNSFIDTISKAISQVGGPLSCSLCTHLKDHFNVYIKDHCLILWLFLPTQTEERVHLPENVSYVDFQTNMVRLSKQIARHAHDMVAKSVTSVQDLGGLANTLTRDYSQLASDCRGAISVAPNSDIGGRLKSCVQDLGTSCIELVQDAGNLAHNPADAFSKKDLNDHARKVSEKVSTTAIEFIIIIYCLILNLECKTLMTIRFVVFAYSAQIKLIIFLKNPILLLGGPCASSAPSWFPRHSGMHQRGQHCQRHPWRSGHYYNVCYSRYAKRWGRGELCRSQVSSAPTWSVRVLPWCRCDCGVCHR